MTISFDAYLRKIRETPLAEQTEHTSRSALETLLQQFASASAARGINVQHEPKREADKGAPDFKIKRRGMILGYVEVKEIGANLDKVLKSDQIKRYRELSDNILLTDYLQWIWIDRERVKGREILAYPTDLEGRTLRVAPERAEAVAKLIAAFFSEAPQGIGRAQQLALALAARARLLRDFLEIELTRQATEHREGRLHALYDVFRVQVFHELSTKEFADAFAQMLAYGLFLARLNAGVNDNVTLGNVRAHIPGSFGLIRELVRFIEEMSEKEYADARWIVEEVLSIVNGLDLAAIHEDLSFRQRKAINRKVRAGDEDEHRLFERDPFIYFYEDFLKAYDPAMRKGRGVYYTPPPIVNFIVRAVDDILKDKFDIRDGLADHKRVTVLDFACGTGTFLLEVFERIFDNIGGADTGRGDPIAHEHILKNLFGFEYLIAPYTIAHLKLSQYLKDKGHPLHDDERLQVFLTNTLEPIEPQKNMMLSFTRPSTARDMLNSCASTFRASLSLKLGPYSTLYPRSDGSSSRPISSGILPDRNSLSFTAKAIARSRPCATREPKSVSGSTRPSSSSPCRRPCGIFTSAAIRSLKNISNHAKVESCRSMKSPM
jgi:N-6 DNA Methylase